MALKISTAFMGLLGLAYFVFGIFCLWNQAWLAGIISVIAGACGFELVRMTLPNIRR